MMNTSFAKKSFLFVALALCFSSASIKAAPALRLCDTNDVWTGGFTLDLGLNYIIASTVNVTVDVNNPVVIQGSSDGESQLVLRAEANQTITFNVNNDLTFNGSCGQLNKGPLLIIVTGPGQVIFNIAGGKTVYFDGATTCGPTKVYVAPLSENEEPTLLFIRQSTSDDGHTRVLIGKDSLMGFAFTTDVDGGESALIKFDPTYDNDQYVEDPCQRMILEIEDCGAFIHTGRRITKTTSEDIDCDSQTTLFYFTCTDIDRKDAAGQNARVQVVNSGTPQSDHVAGLLVLNRNCKLFEMLIDPFGNLGAMNDTLNYKGVFSGLQYGYVHGSNATLEVEDEAYFDYVGLCNNKCPDVSCIPGFELIPSKRVLKFRNGSAYYVDGNHDPDAISAKIVLGENAGMFFRSGIDKDGNIVELFGNELDPENAFTVDDPNNLTPGMGEFVFIAEAPLDVMGDNNPAQQSKMEILSLHVNCNGGPLFADDCDNDRTNFPKRTFFTGSGDVDQVCAMLSYNKAAFLINDHVQLFDTSLVHTDVNHDVFEKNDLRSQPTYVGGEKWTIFEDVQRPKFDFFGSRFNVHSDVAITGMDFRVPNRIDAQTGECIDNNSMFYFYSNWRKLDDGTGRQMILGTHIGSTACDGCKVISRDAHIDVFQTENCDPYCDVDHKLFLRSDANNACINECIDEICDNDSVHNIFLGHSSNISVGTHIPTTPLGGKLPDGCPACPSDVCLFDCETNPMLQIDGNFFAFTSRGGPLGLPSTTHLTGKGGIFVDRNGMFSIDPKYRASIGTMVTRSLNGVANLPKEQIHFANHVGIADWRPDMTDETQRVLVEANENISDYTFHWMVTRKNFEEGYDKFCPYIFRSVNICDCPEVLEENVSALPTVEGTVGQFQIQGSRIGDPAHLLVDGGHIRELVFLHTGHGGDAPVATLVVRNSGRVGIGPAHPSPDTLFATTTFGVNGVTVIADGSGRIDLNEDMIINNRCAFVKGPNYVSGEDVLEITSDVPRVLLVKSTATLDFQCFDNPNDIIRFGGQIRMIFEPGSKILMGGGTVQFANDVIVEMDPYVKAKDFFENILLGAENAALAFSAAGRSSSKTHNPFDPLTGHGNGLANTDSFRTRIIGSGTIQLVDSAKFYIDKDAYVGVETYKEGDCEICTTNITVELKDSGLFSLGNDRVSQGGSLQIGNTVNRTCTQGGNHSVSFTLRLAGLNAKFEMDSQAFFGLNTGIVDRRSDTPNGWLIDVMHNVASITIDLQDGLFEHSDIFAGDNTQAHLLAIGQDDAEGASPLFSFLRESTDSLAEVRLSNANIEGGGNMVRIIRGAGVFKPIVLQDDNTVDVGGGVQHPNMRVSMLASRPLLPDPIGVNVSGDTLFSNLKTTDALTPGDRSQNLGNASAETEQVNSIVSELRIGVVANDDIIRQSVYDIIDATGGSPQDRVKKAAQRGAVNVGLNLSTDPATINFVTQLLT